MAWTFYKPIFEFDKFDNINISLNSAWIGHVNFAYDLVRFKKPRRIVELGTYSGTSFFSFCQGVKDEGISTKCFAIDNWKGDGHTGSYSEEIFQTVKKISSECYPDISVLIRSNFDDAVNNFDDESIDILHIDGYHTFDAVSHDYATWLSKVAQNGIVLFHDISIKINDFGVYKLWEELKSKHIHFQFEHSSGLGVLFPKGCDNNILEVIKKKEELKSKYCK